MTPKIIKLDFLEDDEFGGTDAIALVDSPAIEVDFFTFNRQEFKSYDDYPQAVKDAAARGIRLNKKVNNKCATQVGKVRARQLANGKPITLETIKRMYAYLSRAKEYYNPKDTEACGTISYLLWGGEPALRWTERKLRQIREEASSKTTDTLQDMLYDSNMIGGLASEEGTLLVDANGDVLQIDFSKVKESQEQLTEYLKVVAYIDGAPLYSTKEEAEMKAKEAGCEGSHPHQLGGYTFYMPCESHSKATDKILKDVGEMVMDMLGKTKEKPAKNNFEAFSDVVGEDNKVVDYTKDFKFSDDEEKMIISPLMIPNKLIPRADDMGEIYYAYFTPTTIKKMAHKFMKQKHTDNLNLEHDGSAQLNSISVVESWVKTDKEDKSSKYGYGDLPQGTWFVQLKVEDKNLWDYVKAGVVKGLSLEGNFTQELIKQK